MTTVEKASDDRAHEPKGTQRTMEARGVDPRFAHHEFLSSVAAEDVRFLLVKDRSYGASWKASGGRSAWFMLRRKMDRLLEIMKPPPAPKQFDIEEAVCRAQNMATVGPSPRLEQLDSNLLDLSYLAAHYSSENIFAMIRRDPEGDDGSALAEVRDLRRYLMLVEAEMISRGVVQRPPGKVNISVETVTGSSLDSDTVITDLEPGNSVKVQVGEGGAGGGWMRSAPRAVTMMSSDEPNPALPTRIKLEDGVPRENGEPAWPHFISVDDHQTCGTDAQFYNVLRDAVDPEHIAHLPDIRREVNWLEYKESKPEYRGMYRWVESETKFRLKPAFWNWPGVR